MDIEKLIELIREQIKEEGSFEFNLENSPIDLDDLEEIEATTNEFVIVQNENNIKIINKIKQYISIEEYERDNTIIYDVILNTCEWNEYEKKYIYKDEFIKTYKNKKSAIKKAQSYNLEVKFID